MENNRPLDILPDLPTTAQPPVRLSWAGWACALIALAAFIALVVILMDYGLIPIE